MLRSARTFRRPTTPSSAAIRHWLAERINRRRVTRSRREIDLVSAKDDYSTGWVSAQSFLTRRIRLNLFKFDQIKSICRRSSQVTLSGARSTRSSAITSVIDLD